MSVDAIVSVIGRNMKNKRIMTLSDPRALSRVTEFISTQCLPLDIIMGGGVPVGRLTEIYGDTSTGKSLLATHILASVQTMGGIAQLIDTENATSIEVMEIVGVKIDELLYSTPDTVEEVYADMVDAIEAKMQVDKDMPMVIVWDSIAMTSAQDEIDRVTKEGLNTKSMGVHARLISQMCRIVPRMAKRSNVALIFINQSKSRFGVMFGDNVATFGGKSVPFYSSVRLELKHIRKTKGVDGFNGIEVRARVAKNKIAPPFGVCEIPVLFGWYWNG